MKKTYNLTAIITIVAFVLTFFSCSKSMSDNKKNPTTAKAKPKYEITVMQKGEELGKIVVELFPDVAPKHVANFDSLVAIKFYDGSAFHRVIPGFMIQGGDPNSKTEPRDKWGFGSPDQTRVPAEFSSLQHKRGILSAARSNDPNSATSQFFICVADATFLDGKYSIYGQVVSGMEVADKVVNSPRDHRDNPLDKIEMFIKKIK